MSHTAVQKSIPHQIAHYVSSLSDKNTEAVLTIVKTIAEAEADAEFEKKWAEGIPLDQAFQEVHHYIKTLQWKK